MNPEPDPSSPAALVRADPPLAGDEVATLRGFLDYHRDTLRLKTAGLDHDQLNSTLAPSTMTLAGLLWVADIARLQADPELDFFYREEIGHDTIGAIPPTAAEAADKIASLRRTMVSTMPNHTPEILERSVEITTLGRMTVAKWLPIIVGHVVHHRDAAEQPARRRPRG